MLKEFRGPSSGWSRSDRLYVEALKSRCSTPDEFAAWKALEGGDWASSDVVWKLTPRPVPLPLCDRALHEYKYPSPSSFFLSFPIDPKIDPTNPDLISDFSAVVSWLKRPSAQDFPSKHLFRWRSAGDAALGRCDLSVTFRALERVCNAEGRLLLVSRLDRVTATNLLLASGFAPPLWLEGLAEHGFLDSLDAFIKKTKTLSDDLKSRVRDPPTWYVELSCLTGFRLPPMAGFDANAEMRAFADAGRLTTPKALDAFRAAVRVIFAKNAYTTPYPRLGLREYIASGLWLTTGSASCPKLKISLAGEEVRLRVRKNNVPEVLTVDELFEAAMTKVQENVVIIKPEMAKLRLAVAADLGGYLAMSWLFYLMGSSYEHLPGITLSESVLEGVATTLTMIDALRKGYALPFDFAGFDHQPHLEECKIIISEYFDPISHDLDVIPVLGRVLLSYASIHLRAAWDKCLRLLVKGGLQSGRRETTAVGCVWNLANNELASRLSVLFGAHPPDKLWVRGDDTLAIFPTRNDAVVHRLALAAVGAVGSPGKFGVHERAGEMLRVWYTDVAKGWPAREIPALSERKPWSNTPYMPDASVSAIKKAIDSIARRSPSPFAELLWREVRRSWSLRRRLPVSALSTPSSLGGYGLDLWDGKTVYRRPTVDGSRLCSPGCTDLRYSITQQRFQDCPGLEPATLRSLGEADAVAAMSGSDNPAVIRALKALVKHGVLSVIPATPILVRDWSEATMLLNWCDLVRWQDLPPFAWPAGSAPFAAGDLARYSAVKRFSKVTLSDFAPRTYHALRSLPSSYLRRGLKGEILTDGWLPLETRLHPNLTPFLKRAMSHWLMPSLKHCFSFHAWVWAAQKVQLALEDTITRSSSYRVLWAL